MKLTGRNSRYDDASGAFIVQQSDEMKILMQILKRMDALDAKIDSLIEQNGGAESGGKMGHE